MVLEDASTPEDAFASPAPPSSDMDRYSGDQSPTVLSTRSPTAWPISRPNGLPPLYINFSNLPMPWFPMSQAESDAVAQKQMGDTVQKASDDYYKVVGRPFEQQEGDALVYHLAKALRLASYGPPMGIMTACAVAYRPQARATFRFPGWTPGEKFNPEKFFVLKGSMARAAWHVLRFNAYGVLGLLAGEVLMGSYAMTVANVGRLQDPRLKDVNDTLKRITQERMKEKGLPIEDRTEGKRGPESFEMARQRTRAQGSGTRVQSTGDDMSPTGGSFREDVEGSGGDVGMLSDSQIQQMQQTEQRSEEAAYRASSSAQATPQTPTRPSNSPSASPQPVSSNSGSAWERLRQQAGQPQNPQQLQQQSSRGMQRPVNDDDDAFGLGGGSNNVDQQDRSRMRPAGASPQGQNSSSRSDAQREFDAQLDRERQGESFSEKGGNGRW